MATQRWTGTAAAVSQVSRLTPANVEVADIFTVTCNGKTVSYTAALATVADVCNGLATALAASIQPEFKEFTATNQTTYIQLAGNVAGRPFTVSTSTTDGGGSNTQTLTLSTPTACTGPNFFTDANNWLSGTAPVSNDDVYFDSGSVPLLYGLSQSAITLTSLNVYQSYSGTIGLPLYNAGGYREYRADELAISATTINIGQNAGNGSGRLKFNVGSVACTMNVYNAGQPLEQGIPAVIWRGTNAGNAVNINKGQVGLANFPGQVATIATLQIGYVSSITGDVNCYCGSGCTLTTIIKNGGVLSVNSAATTVTQNAGTLTIWGTGAVTTLNVYDGTCFYNTTGTLTTANVYDKAALDFSQDQKTKTVTTINSFSNAPVINDPFEVVTSLVIVCKGANDLSKLNIGLKFSLTRS